MLRNLRLQCCLLTLICVALLLGPASGAHWHLCLDGGEPPSSFHLFDLGLHHADGEHATPDVGAAHEDVDIAVAGELLSKGKQAWTPLAILLAAAFLFGLLRVPQRFAASFTAPCEPRSLSFLRPPTRGPPSFL